MALPSFFKIVKSEVRRAVNLHPQWAPHKEDLFQDACEAILREGVDGAYARIAARGGIVRKALEYTYVHERSGRSLGARVEELPDSGEADERFQEYEDQDELRLFRARKEGRLRKLAEGISRRKPLQMRMQTVEMYYRYKTSGESMDELAKHYGISRQAVSLRLAVADRDLAA